MTAGRFIWAVGMVGLLGLAGCVAGAIASPDSFFGAWLAGYLFWLGVPLAGIALVLVHDLSGGNWMGTVRPVLNAAIATTPLASLAGIPAFIGLHALYPWTQPSPDLTNVFYLNPPAFFIRYACYLVVWNGLAAYALWGAREGKLSISCGLSWISGLGLIALALSASFAAIDWILSLEPKFWSSMFPYIQTASWFNTGCALVLLVVALPGRPAGERRRHMSDLARIMLATTIFWAYVQFMQFLIIWEENLSTEIHWYVLRLESAWKPAIYVSALLGFVVPFFVLLWAPSKRHRVIVACVCASILIAHIAHTWLMVMPQFEPSPPIWLAIAALVALGSAMMLLFLWALPRRHRIAARRPVWTADHA